MQRYQETAVLGVEEECKVKTATHTLPDFLSARNKLNDWTYLWHNRKWRGGCSFENLIPLHFCLFNPCKATVFRSCIQSDVA